VRIVGLGTKLPGTKRHPKRSRPRRVRCDPAQFLRTNSMIAVDKKYETFQEESY